jgi:hypothetical protein
MTPKSVIFAGACDLKRRGEIDRKDVKSILFDPTICDETPTTLPHAGMQGPCELARVAAFEIGFVGGGAVLALNLVIADGKLHADLEQNGSIHGPASDVRYILSRSVCPTVLATQQPKTPATFCQEPWHIAVNFSFAPVFNNQIFARGFAVYVESDDHPTPGVQAKRRQLVANAFGSAIVLWTAALQNARKNLTGELAAYIDSIVSRSSSGYALLAPAQAVPATCPDFGSIHVRWLTDSETIFPTRKDYVGKAQVEGRTIALDARDFDFVWNLRGDQISQQQTNLIKVLAHEFGHCIGLEHAAPGQRSVMADVLTEIPDIPTAADAAALIDMLGRHIRGTAPGEFNATSCSGLRAKRPKAPRTN